jgi:hypothetical protein
MKKRVLVLAPGIMLIGISIGLAYSFGLLSYLSYGLASFSIVADREYGIVVEVIGFAGIISLLTGILSEFALPKKRLR